MKSKTAIMTWKTAWFVAAVLLTWGLLGAGLAGMAWAQGQGASRDSALVDDLQIMYQINRYGEVAESGPARGETIYYYKCWACHNAITRQGAPYLEGIFERPRLVSGEPVSDETVAAKIKNGGAWMPGFGHSLNDAAIADLLSYLRSDGCCYEALEPPVNPKYRAETRQWPVSTALRGGARGVVRSAGGQLLEGIKVVLIASSGTRTTVFTNDEGRYEFPAMQSGTYTLRIATPAPYKPYRRDGVQVNEAAMLGEIVLEKIPEAGGAGDLPGALPPTLEIQSQLRADAKTTSQIG